MGYRQALGARVLVSFVTGPLLTSAAWGAITNYSSRSAYLAGAPPQSQITFTEVPLGTTLTTQYAGWGVTFTDGDDTTDVNSLYVDGVGLPTFSNPNGLVTLLFSSPITSVGADFPGQLNIALYSGATLVGSSATFGSAGSGFFGGVVSSVPFSRAVLTDASDNFVSIDNVLFSAIPEPAGTTLLFIVALGAGTVRSRRRGIPDRLGGSASAGSDRP